MVSMARAKTPKLKNDFNLIMGDAPEDQALVAKGKFRRELVSHERSGSDAFMRFVRANEGRIRTSFDEGEKRELRRGIEKTLGHNLGMEDRELLDSLFGPPVCAVPPVRHRRERDIRIMTPEQGIAYMRTCTFECFCEWMELSEDFVRNLDDSQFDSLLECIFHVCERDMGLPNQRHVEDGDLERLNAMAKNWHGDSP